MTELEGLSAELRKAAKQAYEVHGLVETDQISESELWLPAGLVEKEMRRIEEKLKYNARWICFGCNSLWENHGDDAKCGNCGKERELWVKLKNIEEVLGK